MRFALLALLLACTDPPQRAFRMPANVEDLRARLLQSIPEGREIAGAQAWMSSHGFACDPALVCRSSSPPPDAGWRAVTVLLIPRNERLADVQVSLR